MTTQLPVTEPLPQPSYWDDRMVGLDDEGEAEGGAEGFRGRPQPVYQRAFLEAMCGRGEFWSPDYEYYCIGVPQAVANACALVNVTPAERWAYLEGCLSSLAHEYAFGVADRA